METMINDFQFICKTRGRGQHRNLPRPGRLREIDRDERALGKRSKAYAVTVHRAQGLTLDSAYIVLGNWTSEGAVYVALSRCRDMDNIGLSRAIRHSDIRIDQEALGFFRRFS